MLCQITTRDRKQYHVSIPLYQFTVYATVVIEVYSHRRRIKTEEKAYRSSLRGKEFIKFFAALAVLPGTILNNRMHSTRMIERKV